MSKENITLWEFKKRLSSKYKQDVARGKDPKPFIVKTNEQIELEKIRGENEKEKKL